MYHRLLMDFREWHGPAKVLDQQGQQVLSKTKSPILESTLVALTSLT